MVDELRMYYCGEILVDELRMYYCGEIHWRQIKRFNDV